jgi:hypothetical protein
MAGESPETNLQQILTGRRPRRRTPLALFLLPVVLLAAVAGWAWRSLNHPEPYAQVVETSICEGLLRQASKVNPDRFYLCASRPKTIWRIEGSHRAPMTLLANAVYELPLDGRTQVEGLSSPDMRYALRGDYCANLLPEDEGRTFLLRKDRSPVDGASC